MLVPQLTPVVSEELGPFHQHLMPYWAHAAEVDMIEVTIFLVGPFESCTRGVTQLCIDVSILCLNAPSVSVAMTVSKPNVIQPW